MATYKHTVWYNVKHKKSYSSYGMKIDEEVYLLRDINFIRLILLIGKH